MNKISYNVSKDNNHSYIIKIIVIILIIFVIFLILQYCSILTQGNKDNTYNKNYDIERLINIPRVNSTINKKIKWSRSKNCNYEMNETTDNVLKENKIENTLDYTKSDILFPCGYNDINKEIASLPHINDETNKRLGPKRVFIIEGADEITAKNYLWKNICNHHGMNYAKQMCPNTYLLTPDYKDKDIARLKKEHTDGLLYIMKKNIQRQEGLEITNDINYIIKNPNNYVLVQELLQDTYLLNKRKINMRIYIVVVCHLSNIDFYIFDDGFMYYTKKDFSKNDMTKDNNITTGYVERDIYQINPLTLKDFKRYLDLNDGEKYFNHPLSDPRKLTEIERYIRAQGFSLSELIFNRIKKLLIDIFITFRGRICKKMYDDNNNPVPIYDDYTIQLFGADISLNDQLQPQIMEINKGPDIGAKDERDGNIKKKLIKDIFEIIGLTESISKDNGLQRILEI